MLPSVGLAGRIFLAHQHLVTTKGHKVSQGALGKAVAAELERASAYTHGAVGDWLTNGVRDVDVLWGIAEATGVSFLWLAIGQGAMVDAAPSTAPADASRAFYEARRTETTAPAVGVGKRQRAARKRARRPKPPKSA